MNVYMTAGLSVVGLFALVVFVLPANAEEPCVAPDNGTGTVDLVADCPYVAPDEPMYIIEGLPPGSTLELDPVLSDYSNQVEHVGGTMGGNYHTFNAYLQLDVNGTGDFAGFHRNLWVPVEAEIHTGPRNPGDPVQTFTAEVYALSGEMFGDPDFCTFRVRAGMDFGLPSPGETTLTQLPSGDFAVDSFFDITYQIEFEGCPGSQLDDMAGTTTATVRWQQGAGFFQPGACCLPDGTCTEVLAGDCAGVFHGSGSICFGDYNDDGIDDACGPEELCVAPDNGTGTVDLVADCPYVAPDEPMYIIEGLPPGSTLELDPILSDYSNRVEHVGGTMGGNYHTFNAYLQLDVNGTGDFAGFHRNLWVPVEAEIHTGPRNPGDPVQTFTAEVYALSGEMFGDPDFCTFRVRAGMDFGLPSPGETTLTQLPSGDFAVDSFFDITYQIEFEGCPGSQLDDMAGTTTATVRWQQGAGFFQPGACCLPDGTCTEVLAGDCAGVFHGSGSICFGDYNDDGIDDACGPEELCVAPDNGTGTVDLVADCPYVAPDEPMYIIEGLPPGSTLELDPILSDYSNRVEHVGGTMGGNYHTFNAYLQLDVNGTGDFAGFHRNLWVPVEAEIHTGPRNPGDPVQTFTAEVYALSGEMFGDPDFCTFRVRAGMDFGLPSPGETTLTQLPSGDFAVDSFFDITYQIEFEGCPGSQLDDMAGTTTATVRWQQGAGYVRCPSNEVFLVHPPDGAIDARKPHPNNAPLPLYGIGMPDDPLTPVNEEDMTPIVIELGVAGAAESCFELCETPAQAPANTFRKITDHGDGSYTIILEHGIAPGAVTTIRYNGGDYVEYIHHPANVDGSSFANANDITKIVDCLNSAGSCLPWEQDIDFSGAPTANDIIEEVNLLNGSGAFTAWYGTELPVNGGDCP